MKGFEPQKAFLGLISTGDENAVLSWRGLAWESARLWAFKDYIDVKWMRKYKVRKDDCEWRTGRMMRRERTSTRPKGWERTSTVDCSR